VGGPVLVFSLISGELARFLGRWILGINGGGSVGDALISARLCRARFGGWSLGVVAFPVSFSKAV